ncbi:hypothetical protein MTR67_052476 [Solanum verrucosum]|uniref:Tf2-1-like SH3-like domain-containing protein n=1 Tax=Solanum verrucosum TaxID=315347 RepID=A0AAF0V965_SOLVR|nr:hypothetical protein MTR67_052476 [Solanum verrucosum]
MEKVRVIQERLKTTQSRQKSYNDVRRRDLEFEVDDWVYLKVSPMKSVMRFYKKVKLSPRYIGSYRISKRIGNVAYELELPQELVAVHTVFHISMLKKCMGDPSLIIPTEDIGIKDSLSYGEIPVQILDRQVRKLRTKEVASEKEPKFVVLDYCLRISPKVNPYELELPSELAAVHPVFHISLLKKFLGDPEPIVPTKNIKVNDCLSYEEIPVQILACHVPELKPKRLHQSNSYGGTNLLKKLLGKSKRI